MVIIMRRTRRRRRRGGAKEWGDFHQVPYVIIRASSSSVCMTHSIPIIVLELLALYAFVSSSTMGMMEPWEEGREKE